MPTDVQQIDLSSYQHKVSDRIVWSTDDLSTRNRESEALSFICRNVRLRGPGSHCITFESPHWIWQTLTTSTNLRGAFESVGFNITESRDSESITIQWKTFQSAEESDDDDDDDDDDEDDDDED